MRRTTWMTAALAFLAFGVVATGANEARGQWAEVSTVRYGLLGRPRAVETRLVPVVRTMPTTTVISSGAILGSPVVSTGVVRSFPSTTLMPTVYDSVVPAAYVTHSAPIMTTEVFSASPVIRSYSPTSTVIGSPVYILP